MPTLPCPQCGHSTPRKLDAPSDYASVNYYRCDHCGHVWTVRKDDPTAITDVTEPRRKDLPTSLKMAAMPKKVLALKWRFDAIHARGRKALAAGDFAGVKAALRIERELIAALNAMLAARRPCRLRQQFAQCS